MALQDNDFVELEFDIYANGKLVQTTDEKKGKEAHIENKTFGPQTIILGKAMVVKALDEDVKKGTTSNILELDPENGYGKRKKELMRTFTKAAFEEQKMRPVVGVVYDFNGMYGTVKSVTGGRVLVDFNNPLAGKDIKIDYKNVKKIEGIEKKVEAVLVCLLRVPQEMVSTSVKEKEITLKVPEQLAAMQPMLEKTFEESIPEFKEYKLKIESFKKN